MTTLARVDPFAQLATSLGSGAAYPALVARFEAVSAVALARGDAQLGDAWRESRLVLERALAARCHLESLELAMRVRYGAMNALSKRVQILAALLETWSPSSSRPFKPGCSRLGRLASLTIQCLRMPVLLLAGMLTLRRLRRDVVPS